MDRVQRLLVTSRDLLDKRHDRLRERRFRQPVIAEILLRVVIEHLHNCAAGLIGLQPHRSEQVLDVRVLVQQVTDRTLDQHLPGKIEINLLIGVIGIIGPRT